MGVKDFNHNVQEFFDLFSIEFPAADHSCRGWLTSLRDPSTSYTALHQASLHGHCDIVKLLVEQDQDLVASKDRRGCLPIHLAAWNGHVQVVEELLRADVGTINSVNNAKESPLHLAAQHGYGGVVSLLLKNRANAQLRNARFETALDISNGKRNICKLLICYCPELVLQSAAECSTADNRTISAKIVYPLHSAARYGNVECLSVLCDSGFNVNYVTEEGSAIHVAAVFGQIESVRLLLSHGVDLNIKDSNGMTVLEKLQYYETHQHTDLTQVIQSKDGWSACKELIEEFLGNLKSIKPVIWIALPENSRAPDQKRTSSKCASTTSQTNQAGTSTSRSNGHHPTAPTVVRPVFPITSTNMLGRSAIMPQKRVKGSLPSGLIHVDQNPSNTLPATCSYQAPPLYDAWTQPKPLVYNNIDNLISAQPPLPLSYDNVPRSLFIYDNAPPPNHRRWDHDCCVSQAKPGQ
uniref:Uncharacterized protein n=1 Tax=Ditylenchus dipsaci TaxID=166011 RepID=A0A915EJT5_9BILA